MQADVVLPQGSKEVSLVAKATDASYNTQPDGVAGVWNLRGVINNCWHRVQLQRSP